MNKKLFWFIASALLGPLTIYAQTPQTGANVDAAPLSAAPSRSNSKIIIKTEPLRNQTIDVDVNGRRVASMEGNQTYSGVFAPGKMRITVPGGKPEGSLEFVAEPNKEYQFNVALVESRSGFFFGGIIGAGAMGTYAITLKETRAIEAVPTSPVESANSAPQSVSGAASVDYIAEAKKSARILGCVASDVKVTGAENNNVLMAANCATGQVLLLTCDQSGVCLRR